MGQKVSPHGLRVGVIKDWDSKWYAEGDFADNLVEDYNIKYLFYVLPVCLWISRRDHIDYYYSYGKQYFYEL